MKILVFGTFDNLHPGHKYFLNEARKRGELFVSIGLDNTVEEIKGRKPRQNQDERIKAIQAEFPEADVRLGDSDNYLKPIEDIKPDLILLGYDQRLPPGISESDIPYPIERIEAHKPEEYKSSLL